MDQLRAIPGYEAYYAVSPDGRVFSYPKNPRSRGARNGGTSHFGKWLKPQMSKTGYHVQYLSPPTGRKRLFMHRLVAMAWIPNPLNLPFINHLNCNKTDNRVANLEWCTKLQNAKHCVAMKRQPSGERHGHAKLTSQNVIEIRAARRNGLTWKELARKFGVSITAATFAGKGKTWRHVK